MLTTNRREGNGEMPQEIDVLETETVETEVDTEVQGAVYFDEFF